MKNPNKVKQGKSDRKLGKDFERRVREDLEENGWITCRWDKNVEFTDDFFECQKLLPIGGEVPVGKLIRSKAKFNPFTKRPMNISAGFPDFLCLQETHNCNGSKSITISEIGMIPSNWANFLVESKMSNKLDKVEKEKMEWIEKELKIPCFVAYKTLEGRKIKINYRRWNEAGRD